MARKKNSKNNLEIIDSPILEFINPFTDFGFKKLFGEESSKPNLIHFLNAVFEGFIPKIASLQFAKNEHLGHAKRDRNAIFDLYCISPEQERFIIELQKIEQNYFKDRALYYSTFAIQEQAKKGTWDFKLSPVYCIGILNFEFRNDDPNYLSFGEIIDKNTNKILIDSLKFAFIECPKFRKQITEDSPKSDKWLYALTQLEHLQSVPNALQEPEFCDFFEKANTLKLNKNDLNDYHASMKYYRDLHNIESQNFDKGKAEGLAEGLAEGEQMGIEKGKAEGEYQAKLAIARTMQASHLPLAQIMALTGLSAHDIERI